ncbi:suppressor of cytokine signaling 7 [Leucoraja erinacea]|uniref:suppressor of cytokine signaling 7 n=1 Tax=Leucoraja erinaceus TaxID=7782 RepID=UPI002458DBD6|nr:suppressor of cytokine signaling 7 [Leucoraja erinacea]
MNPQTAAGFMLLHVVSPDLQEGQEEEAMAVSGSGLALKPLPFDLSRSRRPAALLQDAACRLQHLELPGAKGARPQLMVFRNPALLPPAAVTVTVEGAGGSERPKASTSPGLCPRHRRCPGRARGGRRDERVSDLARDFGDFTVGPGPGGEDAACECPGLGLDLGLGPATTTSSGPGEETSDAVLVLGAMEEPGAEAGPGDGDDDDCPLRLLCRGLGGETEPEPEPEASASPTATAAPPGDPDHPLAARSRRSSLRSRLTRLFRARSCNGAAEAGAKRHSLQLHGPAEGPDISKPRLTRTQSAFTPVSLAPPFTGETVSLVDLDISRREPPSPHPPTPPAPPRRSLSLLDDIGGPQLPFYPVSPAAASLQSLPLPPPPPPHTIQLSLSLSDTLQRNCPQIRPMTLQNQPCPLTRRDSNTFAASLRELEKCGWYWGPMNWDDAEMKLKGKPDGSFLVRDSSDPRYILSLSFRSQGITHHTRMEHYRGTFSLWCHPKFEDRCQSVVEFIERAIMHSKNGKFLYFLRSRVPGLPPTPVQLLYPVSRFSNVKSLQHLCRFRIRQLVRIDHVPDLPLPKPLISYLRKFYYYDPEEETYLSLREARLNTAPEHDMDTQT